MKIEDFSTDGRLFEGAPGYGNRGHGGFHNSFFSKSHWSSLAQRIRGVDDPEAREYLTAWFGKAFKLDNPSFDEDKFKAAVANGKFLSSTQPKFQQRHFYYLAHEVSDVPDTEIREFLAHWLGAYFEGQNEHFQMDRWLKYCNLPEDSSERRWVANNRASLTSD